MRACHGMCGVDGSKKLTKSRLLRSVPSRSTGSQRKTERKKAAPSVVNSFLLPGSYQPPQLLANPRSTQLGSFRHVKVFSRSTATYRKFSSLHKNTRKLSNHDKIR